MAHSTGVPDVDAVLDRVPMFDGRTDIDVELLSGGLTNVNYLMTAGGERFVVRIAGENTESLGIDREREAAAVHEASIAGIAPEPVAFLLPEGHSVTRFVEGARQVTLDDARSEGFITRMAARLRDIHALDSIEGMFDPYHDIERWIDLAADRGVAIPDALTGILNRVERTRLERAVALDQLVLCHNDSYYLNVLDDGQLWILDWEYAGMGDPFYDLAANAFELTSTGRDILLTGYFGDVTDDLRRTLNDVLTVFLAWNVAWSLVQVHDSDVDYDYGAFANGLLKLVPPEA
jgi:thiamine kinase-like enzyme